MFFWGCMNWENLGELYKIEGTLTGEKYCEIISGPLKRSLKLLYPNKVDKRIIGDNDPKHTS